MKRPIIFILVVGVLLGLLARSGAKEVAPISSPTDNATTYKKYYTDGCVGAGSVTYEYCSCSYDYIIANYGFNTLLDESVGYTKTGIVSDRFSSMMDAAIDYCI
jgi:hypothetical protein